MFNNIVNSLVKTWNDMSGRQVAGSSFELNHKYTNISYLVYVAKEDKNNKCWDIVVRLEDHTIGRLHMKISQDKLLLSVESEAEARQWLNDHKDDIEERACKYLAEMGVKRPCLKYPKIIENYNRI